MVQDLVISLSKCDKNDAPIIGHRAVVLADLLSSKFPVPHGFVVTTKAYGAFVKENRLDIKIKHLIGTINFNDMHGVTQVSRHIQKLISEAVIPDLLAKSVFKEYEKLNSPDVMISADTPDSHICSGESVILERIRTSWAQLYTPGYLLQLNEGLKKEKLSTSILIQQYIPGVTGEIYTSGKEKAAIKIVIGKETIEVNKTTLKIPESSPLAASVFEKLIDLGLKIEEHLYFPQKITFVLFQDVPYVLNSEKTFFERQVQDEAETHAPIYMGEPVVGGIGVGRVQTDNFGKKPVTGNVIVSKYLPHLPIAQLKKAAAIIVSSLTHEEKAKLKELGVPVISGDVPASHILKNERVITVNGKTGIVNAGSIKIEKKSKRDMRTATKIMINTLSHTKTEADGVGNILMDKYIMEYGKHPKKQIDVLKEDQLLAHIAKNAAQVCKAVYPRSVFLKTSNLTTDQYRVLVGGKSLESDEYNPHHGYRGAFRHINDPRVFKIELDAIKKVREKEGYKNLMIVLPFIRSVSELSDIQKILLKNNIKRSYTCKVFLSVDVVSNAILIHEFLDSGIDGIVLDANTVTEFMLGKDFRNTEFTDTRDYTDKSVMWAYERVIKASMEHGLPVHIVMHEENNELLNEFINLGVTSVSVPEELFEKTRDEVISAEKKLLAKITA